MREKIERTTCDACRTTYEHVPESYGGKALRYLVLLLPDPVTRAMVEKHFCCFKCLWRWVQENRKP